MDVTPAADGAIRASGTGRILSNTVYRAAADVGSKIVSLAFFLMIARQLGSAAFGLFTFGLSFAALTTVLAGLGQDAILTREVAQDRRLVDRYFANTLALKIVVAVPVVLVSFAAMTLYGADSRTPDGGDPAVGRGSSRVVDNRPRSRSCRPTSVSGSYRS